MIEKYLSRYAQPESGLAARLPGGYAAALVVPALGEPIELLAGYRDAARRCPGRVLVVLVVNASPATSPELRGDNARLLAELAASAPGVERLAEGAMLIAHRDFDVAVVDRASPGRELEPKQGVGLARKIGMDVALALVARGKVASPWLFSTDADAALPPGYFEAPAASATAGASAVLFPFRHVGGDDAVTVATLRYEASLRYQVLGLAAAGSPYAYPSVGSAIAVDAAAYARVRGVPRREAGEDFYLLDKLAKIGPLARLPGEPVTIRARRSNRVPFGTGPSVSAILERDALLVPSPEAFVALACVLRSLDAFAIGRREQDLESFGDTWPPARTAAVADFLTRLGWFAACREAARVVGGGSLRRRLHTWFDALRTRRVLHALRDTGLEDVALEVALAHAPFTPGAAGSDLPATLARLSELERGLPALVGPTLA